MNKKFQNKYRIESTRKPGWDYSTPGLYFVTICTQHREHYFGEIRNGEMFLSDIGHIAKKFLAEIPQHFRFTKLHTHQIMPDHLHAIIEIMGSVNTPESGVSTTQKWKPKTLGVIINQFKRVVTINARKLGTPFAWQSRFHDHIIRNSNEYDRIDAYIKNNVANWKCDKYLR